MIWFSHVEVFIARLLAGGWNVAGWPLRRFIDGGGAGTPPVDDWPSGACFWAFNSGHAYGCFRADAQWRTAHDGGRAGYVLHT